MTTVQHTETPRYDKEAIRVAAAGRWPEILSSMAGIPIEYLSGTTKEHPCPICGGETRFRMIDVEAGACYCNQCFSKKNGDGFAAYMWATGKKFNETLASVAHYLGIEPSENGNGKPTTGEYDPIARMAETKRCPVDSLKVYGATPFPERKAVAFLMYGGDGNKCSQFNVFPDAKKEKERKGLNAKGKPAGMFLPHDEAGNVRLPKPGETWIPCEGVKDAAALHGLGFLAVGLPGKYFKAEWAPLFEGVNLVVLLDNDVAGMEASPKVVKAVEETAASVQIAHLPHHGDVRDNLAQPNGEAVVRQAIDAAGSPEADDWPTEEYDAAELAHITFPQRYLIDEAVVELQPGIAGGPGKVLKTGVAAVDLGVSAAAGVPWLDRFEVPEPIPTGIISAESGMATLQETILRVAAAKDLDLASLKGMLRVTPEPPNLCSATGINAMVDWCKRRGLRLAIVDPAYLAFPELAAISANVFAVGEALRKFSSIVIKEGITPIIIHHTVKTLLNKYAALELQDLSGSGWCEFARQWILLNRRSEYADGSGLHELHLRIGGSAGHSSLWHLDIDEGEFQPGTERVWRTNLVMASVAKRDKERAKETAFNKEVEAKTELIVKHLQRQPNWADSESRILKGNVGRSQAAQQALEQLKESKRIVWESDCVIKGGRKSGREGYRLQDEVTTNDENETTN